MEAIINKNNHEYLFNNKQIFVPPGFAHGFLCLSNKCIINYYCTETFDNKDEYKPTEKAILKW